MSPSSEWAPKIWGSPVSGEGLAGHTHQSDLGPAPADNYRAAAAATIIKWRPEQPAEGGRPKAKQVADRGKVAR